MHRDVTYELEQYPEDKTEPDLEKQCAPAIRHHMQNFLANIDSRGKPVADIEQGYISTDELHPGQYVDEAGPHAGLGCRTPVASLATKRPIGFWRGRIAQPWVHPEPEKV